MRAPASVPAANRAVNSRRFIVDPISQEQGQHGIAFSTMGQRVSTPFHRAPPVGQGRLKPADQDLRFE